MGWFGTKSEAFTGTRGPWFAHVDQGVVSIYRQRDRAPGGTRTHLVSFRTRDIPGVESILCQATLAEHRVTRSLTYGGLRALTSADRPLVRLQGPANAVEATRVEMGDLITLLGDTDDQC